MKPPQDVESIAMTVLLLGLLYQMLQKQEHDKSDSLGTVVFLDGGFQYGEGTNYRAAGSEDKLFRQQVPSCLQLPLDPPVDTLPSRDESRVIGLKI